MLPRQLSQTCVLLCLLWLPATIWAQKPPNLGAEDYQKIAASAVDRTVHAPFIKVGKSIVVRMHINGRGPFNLVLDTGAELTIISPAAAAKLKLRDSGRGIRLAGVTGGTRAILTKIDTLSLDGAAVRNLRVAVAPIKHLNAINIIGLLGQDFLSRFRLEIDSEKQLVTLHPPRPPSFPEGSLEKDFNEIIKEPEELFKDLFSIREKLDNHYYKYVADEPRHKDTLKTLDGLQAQIADIRKQVGKSYHVLLNVPNNHLDNKRRNHLQKFLYCYPTFEALIDAVRQYAVALSRAYRNPREAYPRLKANLEGHFQGVDDLEFQFKACR